MPTTDSRVKEWLLIYVIFDSDFDFFALWQVFFVSGNWKMSPWYVSSPTGKLVHRARQFKAYLPPAHIGWHMSFSVSVGTAFVDSLVMQVLC